VTDEQTRTRAYYEERYTRQVMLKAHGHVKSTRAWHAYQEAVADYFGYRRWLDTFVLNRRAAA
jgi:hypothetical protein